MTMSPVRKLDVSTERASLNFSCRLSTASPFSPNEAMVSPSYMLPAARLSSSVSSHTAAKPLSSLVLLPILESRCSLPTKRMKRR